MNLPVAEKASVLQSWDHAQHAGLLAKLQMILEADQVVGIGAKIFLTQLNYGVGHSPGTWIYQSDGLHGTKAQRVTAAARDLFDGQAALKIIQLLPITLLDRLRRQ